jgi:hypothetical protein
MKGYLGERILTRSEVEQLGLHKAQEVYSSSTAIQLWIEQYSGCDGAHHKDWLIDQIARINLGAEIIVSEASWDNGTKELRYELDKPTEKYLDWVASMKDGEDGPDTYDYNTGIAP